MKAKTKKLLVVGLISLGLVAILGPLLALYYFSQPVSRDKVTTVQFVIPKGQAVQVIGQRLKEANLIRSPLVFRVVVKLNKLESKIQAGSFDLSPGLSTNQLALKLTKGTKDVWVTILEGWRTEEIADSLAAQDLAAFDRAEFIELAKDSEGMLFPDTYLIPRDMSTKNIHQMLLNTFKRKVLQGLAKEISASKRDFNDVLVMASLVEREAKGYEQKRLVAGILWNRIDLGMALQVDATLQYVNGYDEVKQTWWAPPTSAQKKLESAFNTYLNPGLPPKPISNPGLETVKATLLPLKTNDLYYLHASNGAIYTAKTLEQHNSNINKYLR